MYTYITVVVISFSRGIPLIVSTLSYFVDVLSHTWMFFFDIRILISPLIHCVFKVLLLSTLNHSYIYNEYVFSTPVFSRVRVTRSLVLCVDSCLCFCISSFGHCVVCFSSIYGFWLPLWYLQTLLAVNYDSNNFEVPMFTYGVFCRPFVQALIFWVVFCRSLFLFLFTGLSL